jgi:hypothetical protein
MSPNQLCLWKCEALDLIRKPSNTVPNFILERHCPLDDGHYATNTDYSRASSLGLLSCLPVELQQEIIRQLDVKSLIEFRRVSKRAMDLVANLPEWEKVSKHIISASGPY